MNEGAALGAGHSRAALPTRRALLALWLGAGAATAQTLASSPAKPARRAPPATAPVRLPPSTTLDYVVSGRANKLPFTTRAQLQWQHGTTDYRLAWVVNVPLLGPRTQRSEGAVTPAGLVPERYTESARRERSAHLDRAAGRIHFSGGQPSAAWQPDTQDRLSTSLQLGALLAAAPERYRPGTVITVHTSGVRDAEPWQWRVLPDETLQVAGRGVPTARLARLPRKPDDTELQLWLGRTLDYLPVRLRMTDEGNEYIDQRLSAWPTGRP
ncbi:MAG: DUF3108 domain-containing protein [Pseudomonadota bacterium]|nr:DUF3108 domain-containing protein [Pseudomonadota bacterium]